METEFKAGLLQRKSTTATQRTPPVLARNWSSKVSSIYDDYTSSRTWREATSRVRSKRFWRDIWDQIVADAAKIHWTWLARRFCSHVIPASTIVAICVVLRMLTSDLQLFTNDACTPDGKFSFAMNNEYNPWRPDSVFSVDLTFGDLTFGPVKVIDVAWDLLVGRAGQAILAMFSYQTFRKALSWSMEHSTVSRRTFKALTLQEGTISGLWGLVRTVSATKSILSRLVISWAILSVVFTLSLPTWVSAMTGYTAVLQAFVRSEQNNLIPLKDMSMLLYTIHDGERVGQKPNFRINASCNVQEPAYGLRPADFWQDQTKPLFGCTTSYLPGYLENPPDVGVDGCTWMWLVSNYTSKYGFSASGKGSQDYIGRDSFFVTPNGTNLTFPNTQPLNISLAFSYGTEPRNGYYHYYSDEWYSRPFGFWGSNNTQYAATLQTTSRIYYYQDTDDLFSLDELNGGGACQSVTDVSGQSVRYAWGFNYVLTTLFLITLLVWTTGTFTLYLLCYCNSRLDANHRQLGMERAILDLSISVHEKMDANDVLLHSNDEIEQTVGDHLMTYSDLCRLYPIPPRHVQLRTWWRAFRVLEWIKAETWWLAAFSIFLLICIISATGSFGSVWYPSISFIPLVSILVILVVGKRYHARWLLFAIGFTLFLILDIVFSSMDL